MAVVTKKPFSPSDVVAALLALLPDEFSNDPRKIHSTMARLQEDSCYASLLEDFDFLDYAAYPYSPLLARILNRMQESRLLCSLNPEYERYQMKGDPRKAIIDDIVTKKFGDQEEKLREIACKLAEVLK